jgi:DNA polymerase I-like protein with 3'-5' exonuclease and polymerase domains
MKAQRCYNGARYLGPRAGPSTKNIDIIDKGCTPMIARMQRRGLQVDLTHFARLDVELTQDMDRVTEEVHQLTGHYINLGSGDQVAELLFKKLGLVQAKQKFTASGDRESVEDEVLTAIQHQHPVVGKCLEYKEYEKLKGTYVRPIPKLAKRTSLGKWRIYPHFRTTRVPSGRLACADPNLLAMPTRTERGRDIRKGFITDSGWRFLSVDESQIEVRIAAHRSQDTNLCNVYINEEDVYSDFAITAFRLADKRYKPEDGGKWKYPGVDAMEHRRPSKTCVLASIYDVTAGGLQEQLPIVCATCNKPGTCLKCAERKPHNVPEECVQHDCANFRPLWTEEKSQHLITAFYSRYPGLMRMRIDDHNYMRQNAYIVDDWGRLQHITAVRSVLPWVANGGAAGGR